LLDEIGLNGRRLEMFHIGASDAPQWRDAVKLMTERALEMGPNPLKDVPEEDARANAEPMPIRALAI